MEVQKATSQPISMKMPLMLQVSKMRDRMTRGSSIFDIRPSGLYTLIYKTSKQLTWLENSTQIHQIILNIEHDFLGSNPTKIEPDRPVNFLVKPKPAHSTQILCPYFINFLLLRTSMCLLMATSTRHLLLCKWHRGGSPTILSWVVLWTWSPYGACWPKDVWYFLFFTLVVHCPQQAILYTRFGGHIECCSCQIFNVNLTIAKDKP